MTKTNFSWYGVTPDITSGNGDGTGLTSDQLTKLDNIKILDVQYIEATNSLAITHDGGTQTIHLESGSNFLGAFDAFAAFPDVAAEGDLVCLLTSSADNEEGIYQYKTDSFVFQYNVASTINIEEINL